MINIKSFCPNKINIDGKSYKNVFIYYIGYASVENLNYIKTNSVKNLPLFLIMTNRTKIIMINYLFTNKTKFFVKYSHH